MKRIVSLMIVIAFFAACKPIKEVPVKTELHVRDRIVTVPVSSDSALIRLLIECDSARNAIVKGYDETKTDGVNTALQQYLNELAISFKTPSREFHTIVKDTTLIKEVPVIVTNTEYINKLHWWQQMLMFFGVAFLAIIIYSIFKYAKNNS